MKQTYKKSDEVPKKIDEMQISFNKILIISILKNLLIYRNRL